MDGDGRKLHIGNIAYEISAATTLDLLKQCGPVVHFDMPPDPSGICPHRGFAIVTYATEAAAANCIAMLQGYMMHNRPLRVQVAMPSSTRASGAPFFAARPPFGGGMRGGSAAHGMHNPGGLQPSAPTTGPVAPAVSVGSVRSVVESLSAAQQWDVLASLKAMDRDSAAQLLSTCPSFAHAVLMMEERLGMLQILPADASAPREIGALAAGPPSDAGIDRAQLQEILALTDAQVEASAESAENKAVMMKVRRAVAWPLPKIMALGQAERDELLTLRLELQAVLGGPK